MSAAATYLCATAAYLVGGCHVGAGLIENKAQPSSMLDLGLSSAISSSKARLMNICVVQPLSYLYPAPATEVSVLY